ncbi:MAG TPA: oligosaccharide flippase family protein [Ignavibacteriaceae bacterium]|nr:oligosaccharide flippase family protein [Ignavibacteriaceae bacterium]
MSSLTKRTFTLAISETLHYAVQFLSPIFLVRILDKDAYGQYREFIVYSSLLLTFISFSVKANLIYFISKDPDKEKEYVSNTVFLQFAFSVIGLILIFIFKTYIEGLTTFDFIFLLMVFIFLTQVDLLESYWLAKKRTDLVLYWSSGNIIIRTGSIILVAYLTRDVLSIIYLLIAHEFLKSGYTLIYIIRKKLLMFKWNFSIIKNQLVYIVPLGLSSLILKFNTDISKVIISANLGAAALATYTVGAQNLPLINIIRTSITNTVFPEMAQRSSKNPLDALNLWNKSTLLYLFLMTPMFYLVFFYSDLIITTLYTSQYHDAVILFRIYSILLLRKCFEMGMPLRAMNKNKFFVIGNILSLGVNIVLIYALYNLFGFVGPAIAYVFTEFTLNLFLATKILSTYNIKLPELFFWKKMGQVLAIGTIGVPILLLGNFFRLEPITAAILFSFFYLAFYLLVIRKLGINEIDMFMKKLLKKVRLSW